MSTLLKILLTPSCWIRVGEFSREWDKTLNALLNQYTFTDIDPYKAMLGPYQVWIANHPYGSFTPHCSGVSTKTWPLPSRETAFRAQEILLISKAKKPQ